MSKYSSNSLNGLVSELKGFRQHAHRFETLEQTFAITREERLEFARPVFSSSRNEMTWYTEGALPNARPLTALGSEERKAAELEYNQCLSAIEERLAGMSHGVWRVEQFRRFVRIPDVSSILVVPDSGGRSFVLLNWGSRDSSVIIDDEPDDVVSLAVVLKAVDGTGSLSQPNKKLVIQIGAGESFTKFTDGGGCIDLGHQQKGTKVVVNQAGREWVKELGHNEQVFHVESQAQQPLLYRWSAEAAARIEFQGTPSMAGWSELLFQSDAINRPLKADSTSDQIVEGLTPGSKWSILGQSDSEEQQLATGIVEEGLNVCQVKFDRPEPKPGPGPKPDGNLPPPEPPKGPLNLRWENFLGRPLKNQGFTVQEVGAVQKSSLKTDKRGYAEIADAPFGANYELNTNWGRRDWPFKITHNRDVGEHVIQLKTPVPWWLLVSLGAILLLTLLAFWRVPFSPEIRMIDAVTEVPVANAEVSYYNFEGQQLSVSTNSDGIAELTVGERPLYKKIFQLNPDSPMQAAAAGYEPAQSTMDVRTWYWTVDWPLEPSHEISLEIETYDAGNQVPLPGTYVELVAQKVDGSEHALFSGYSDANGLIQVVMDDRDLLVSSAQKPTYVELNKLSATGRVLQAGDAAARQIRLAPTVGCDKIYTNQEGTSTRVFDLGKSGAEFCFQAGNYNDVDNIVVLDADGQVLFNLDYATGDLITADPSTYESVTLRSETRLVYVEVRDGGTNWWFELNCPGSGCRDISRHPWTSTDETVL